MDIDDKLNRIADGDEEIVIIYLVPNPICYKVIETSPVIVAANVSCEEKKEYMYYEHLRH